MSTTHQMTIQGWLDEMENHTDDPRWLDDNEDKLFQDISAGLYTPCVFHDTIKLLNQVYPYYALVRFRAKRWSPLLINGLMQAMDLRDNEMLIQIYTQLGESQLITGKSQGAHDSFQTALDRAQEGESQAAMLAVYIGLIRVQALNLDDAYSETLVDNALQLNPEVDDLALTSALYQAICLASLTWKQPVEAFEFGQSAFVGWYALGKEIELGKSAALIAEVFRFTQNFRQAESWLDLAADYFFRTGYKRQDALISYQRGALLVDQGELDAGEQWLQQSLEEASAAGWDHYIALASHSLGILQGKQKKFTNSEANLKNALKFWEKMGDIYEMTAIHHAMGWLENKRGNSDAARKWFHEGLQLAERIPHQKQREYMQKLISETIDEIED